MKCFYHNNADAVAICKSCHRALCAACAADVPPGTACANRCEQDVAALNLLVEMSKASYQKTGQVHYRNAIVMSAAGVAFFLSGIWLVVAQSKHPMALKAFLAVMGLLFLLWAYFSYRSGKQIESAEENA